MVADACRSVGSQALCRSAEAREGAQLTDLTVMTWRGCLPEARGASVADRVSWVGGDQRVDDQLVPFSIGAQPCHAPELPSGVGVLLTSSGPVTEMLVWGLPVRSIYFFQVLFGVSGD